MVERIGNHIGIGKFQQGVDPFSDGTIPSPLTDIGGGSSGSPLEAAFDLLGNSIDNLAHALQGVDNPPAVDTQFDNITPRGTPNGPNFRPLTNLSAASAIDAANCQTYLEAHADAGVNVRDLNMGVAQKVQQTLIRVRKETGIDGKVISGERDDDTQAAIYTYDKSIGSSQLVALPGKSKHNPKNGARAVDVASVDPNQRAAFLEAFHRIGAEEGLEFIRDKHGKILDANHAQDTHSASLTLSQARQQGTGTQLASSEKPKIGMTQPAPFAG